MAFPRSFKNETWFMRLPTGEVEVVTASALERAFRCGLADARTPVRSVASPVWTTLAEAAEIDTSDPRAPGSLLPVALDEEPAADLASGKPWQVRTEVDPRTFRSSAGRIVTGAAALACVALVALGASRAPDVSASRATSAMGRGDGDAAHPRAPAGVVDARELHRPTKDEPQGAASSAEVERRLREMDALRRANEAAAPRPLVHPKRSRTPLAPPLRPAGKGSGASSPFTNGGSRHDPLNGAL